jgi:hypothetical protein
VEWMGPTVEVVDDDLDDANGIVEDDDVGVWSVDGRVGRDVLRCRECCVEDWNNWWNICYAVHSPLSIGELFLILEFPRTHWFLPLLIFLMY